MIHTKKFDKFNQKLEGSNLIEASAGTGKTYSLAILALRLILEKKIPIEKILMVTFTNAAVAELESRIREFVRKAYKYATGQPIDMEDDADIQQVVDNADAGSRETILKKAVQSLDKLSVMTIHSFCQQTIDEFTFETRQDFDYEVITDDSALLGSVRDKFVREVLNVMDYKEFQGIHPNLKLDKLPEMLRKYLQDMTFIDSGGYVDIVNFEKNKQEKYEALKKAVQDNFEKIRKSDINPRTKLAKSSTSAEAFLPVFIHFCCIKKEKEYIDCFDYLYYSYGEDYAKAMDYTSQVYIYFLKRFAEDLKELKISRSYISYDDQIKTIHNALDNPLFTQKLSQKYEAVFIDEFQDTDKYQYEIFSKVFSGKILFYIGDPKQSIYGWRGADLDTYKTARAHVKENVFTLDKNFRSTARVIKAMEQFMRPDEQYNMFKDSGIFYETVGSGSNRMGDMYSGDKPVTPLTIWKMEKDENLINRKVAHEITALLGDDYAIIKPQKENNGKEKMKSEKISPGDIGVLVRTGKQGKAIKKNLAELGVNAVLRDDTRVIESDEADMIRYLITAVLTNNKGNISRVLLTPMTGFTHSDLLSLNEEEHAGNFSTLSNVLQESGIFNMIASFQDIYGVRHHCAKSIEGQRVLTNINQIAEILHRVQRKGRLTAEELMTWMERNKESDTEEFQQRIESDEDAVQISTIHKAKGLQYKIVFAPSLSHATKKFRNGILKTYKKNGKYHFTLNASSLPEEDQNLITLQEDQENRRLIYVALTRTIYKCYTVLESKDSSLSEMFAKYTENTFDNQLIEVEDVKDSGTISEEWQKNSPPDPVFTGRTSNLSEDEIRATFKTHSFSWLNKAKHSYPFEPRDISDRYDRFMLQDLSRGAFAGTALHNIFERLDFTRSETWDKALDSSLQIYSTLFDKDSLPHLKEMLEHTLEAEISCGSENIRLNTIPFHKTMRELNFYFSIKDAQKTELNLLMGEEAQLKGNSAMNGLMTGFVDLIFEHNNKYYILDWKSNYLGNTLEDYSTQAVEKAMKASNYTLQYLIYTVAVKRWLESRIPDFDYERDFGGAIYLFLRGLRRGNDTGVYFSKPSADRIRQLDEVLGGK